MIGRNVWSLRMRQGMTLNDLAARADVGYQNLWKYENGENRIAASTLYRLSIVLQCSIDAFYAGLDGIAETGAPLGVRREDHDAALAITRIEDEHTRDCLREFIEVLTKP